MSRSDMPITKHSSFADADRADRDYSH